MMYPGRKGVGVPREQGHRFKEEGTEDLVIYKPGRNERGNVNGYRRY